MSLILWLGVALADPTLHAREPLAAGVPIEPDQLYAVDLGEHAPAGASTGPRSQLAGRVPRFAIPADAPLREAWLQPVEGVLPPGTAPLSAHTPFATKLQVGDRVDVWLRRDGAACLLAADRPVVLARRNPVVTVPEAAVEAMAGASPVFVLRPPADDSASPGPDCTEAP